MLSNFQEGTEIRVEKIRFSITRLKLMDIQEDAAEARLQGWKDKILDYEIETLSYW